MAKQEMKKNPTSDETIHPGQLTIFDAFHEIEEDRKAVSKIASITKNIQYHVKAIFDSYLTIGRDLITVQKDELYKTLNYENVYDYAQNEFDMSVTAIKNTMAIVNRFCDDQGRLKSEYKSFNYSQLVELVSVKDEDINRFQPTMTVKDTRLEKKKLAIIEKYNHLFGNDSEFLKSLIDYICDYDYNSKFTIYDGDFECKHEIIDNEYNEFYEAMNFIIIFTIKHDDIEIFHIEFSARSYGLFQIEYARIYRNDFTTFEEFEKSFESFIDQVVQKLEASEEEVEESAPTPWLSSDEYHRSVNSEDLRKITIEDIHPDKVNEFFEKKYNEYHYPLIKVQMLKTVKKEVPYQAKIDGEETFVDEYGQSIEMDIIVTTCCPGPKYRPNILDNEWKFCPYCGQRIIFERVDDE